MPDNLRGSYCYEPRIEDPGLTDITSGDQVEERAKGRLSVRMQNAEIMIWVSFLMITFLIASICCTCV